MIRPTLARDVDAVLTLAEAIGLFGVDQLGEVRGMFVGYLEGGKDSGRLWLTDEHAGGVLGVAYCEVERMARGTWN